MYIYAIQMRPQVGSEQLEEGVRHVANRHPSLLYLNSCVCFKYMIMCQLKW